MPESIPAIFLDLDGTLIDSLPGILASCRAALRTLGREPQLTLDISLLVGLPVDEMMRALLKPYGDDRVPEAVAAYRADYGVNGLFESILYPGIAQAPSDMREAGAQLYLATSNRTVFARRILEHLGLDMCFDGIYCSEPGGARDHKLELISYILSRHALPPEGCVMVGDLQYDIAGAHPNRMRALGVLWAYGSRDELETVGADGLVVEPSHLLEAALVMAQARIR